MRETKGLIEATESNLTLGAGRKLTRGALARRFFRMRCAVPAAPIAVLCTMAVFSSATPASAGEYCRKDVMSQMVSCSFDSLEQCQWTSSGRGGDCFRDPWLPPAHTLAYAPSALHAKSGHIARTQRSTTTEAAATASTTARSTSLQSRKATASVQLSGEGLR